MGDENNYIIDLNAFEQGACGLSYELKDAFFQREESKELLGGCCSAEVNVARMGDVFTLKLSVQGVAQAVCDRCLEAVAVPVDCSETLTVKLAVGEDEGDIVYVNPADGTLDIAWLLYELVVINLPIVHSHQPGECNPQMEDLLLSHLCTLAEDEDNGMADDDQPE